MRRLLLGMAAGVVAGSIVGLADAIYVLSSEPPVEYLALAWAVPLYGAAGLALGGILGLALVVAGYAWPALRPPHRAYTLAFASAGTALCGLVAAQEIDRVAYLDQGLPLAIQLALLASLVALALAAGWIGPILLTRTPFKIALRLRGTLAMLGVLGLLSAVFSFSPVSGGDPAGWIAPERVQDDALLAGPNTLLILVDSLRADRLGGERAPLTPNLERLARRGIRFEQAIAQSNWTRGAVASLLSSALPSTHGVADRKDVLDDDVLSLAELLQERGLVTAALFNHPDLLRSCGLAQGFDWYPHLAPRFPFQASLSASRLGLYRLIRRLRARRSPVVPGIEEYYQPADLVLDRARGFVEANRDRRWFLVLHLMEPHPPLLQEAPLGNVLLWEGVGPPVRGREDAAREAYDHAVQLADANIGDFLTWLDEGGLLDRTLVVVSAPHGIALGERGAWGTGCSLHDELLRVPLLMRLPAGAHAGTSVPWQVRQVDIAATIAARYGLPIPRSWQGQDLIDEVERRAAPDAAVGSASEASPPAPPWREALAESGPAEPEAVALRMERWKLVQHGAGARPSELYDLLEDPAETQDLGEREVDLRQRLERLLSERLQEAERARGALDQAPIDPGTAERLEKLGYRR